MCLVYLTRICSRPQSLLDTQLRYPRVPVDRKCGFYPGCRRSSLSRTLKRSRAYFHSDIWHDIPGFFTWSGQTGPTITHTFKLAIRLFWPKKGIHGYKWISLQFWEWWLFICCGGRSNRQPCTTMTFLSIHIQHPCTVNGYIPFFSHLN